MITLDWIPVICRKIGRNSVGRRYAHNRLRELQQALAAWLDQQNDCADKLSENALSRGERSNMAIFCGLLKKELTLLKIAVANIEIWSNGGGDVSLTRAQKAYSQAQDIWKRRMSMLQKMTVYPQRYV